MAKYQLELGPLYQPYAKDYIEGNDDSNGSGSVCPLLVGKALLTAVYIHNEGLLLAVLHTVEHLR